MKNNIVGICILCSIFFILHAADSEFVIKDAKKTKQTDLSKNELKEKIGNRTKDAFDLATGIAQEIGTHLESIAAVQQSSSNATVALQGTLRTSAACTSTLAGLQKECVFLQKTCSSIAEKLLDNKAPFKKAFRKDLAQTNTTLSSVLTSLQSVKNVLGSVTTNLKKSKSVNALQSQQMFLAQQQQALLAVHNMISKDACLKLV